MQSFGMPHARAYPVYRLLFQILSVVVDHQDQIMIKTIWTDEGGTFMVSVSPEDEGKLIGNSGNVIKSIRVVLHGIGMKMGRQFRVEVEELPVEVLRASRLPCTRL